MRLAIMALLHFGILALALFCIYSVHHEPILVTRCLLGIFSAQIALWAIFSRSLPDKMRKGNRLSLALCVLWVVLWGAAPQALLKSIGFAWLGSERAEAEVLSSRKTQVQLKLGARTRWFARIQFQTADQAAVETEIELERSPEGAISLPIAYLTAFPTLAYAPSDPAWTKDFSSRFVFPMIFLAIIGFLLAIRPGWSKQTKKRVL